MSQPSRVLIFLLRISFGWLFFYAGITKVINPNWSAGGYLNSAKTFSGFYSWLASPGILEVVNFLNQWGLVIIGAALIFGVFVRFFAFMGAVFMILYYFPILSFPFVGEHSYLVEEHIIYALALLYLSFVNAGKVWGFDGKIFKNLKNFK